MTACEVECVELPSLQHSPLASGQREERGVIFGARKHGEHSDRLRSIFATSGTRSVDNFFAHADLSETQRAIAR